MKYRYILILFCLLILSGCTKIKSCENNEDELNTITDINWYTTDLDNNNLALNFSDNNGTSTIFYPKPFRQGTTKIVKDTMIFTPTTFFESLYDSEIITILKKCPNELILKFEDGAVYSYFQ